MRTVSRAEFLQGVSAGFRHAERRKPAAAAPVDMIDIVGESDAPECCRRFPPFAPFPPVVFRSPGEWRSGSGMGAAGDAKEITRQPGGGADQAIVMGEFAIVESAARRLSGCDGHLSILMSECRQGYATT